MLGLQVFPPQKLLQMLTFIFLTPIMVGYLLLPHNGGKKNWQAIYIYLRRRKNDKRVEIDGYSDFLFLNRKNYPKVASDYNGMMKGLVKKYNKYNEDKLPHITPHSLRHTFCTNYANAGMNPKALQYIMGHANIAMTLNYYAHATFDSAMAEMKRLNKEKQQERLVA